MGEFDDPRLSALYQQGPGVEPDAASDDAILHAARDAVRRRPNRSFAGWAVAATLVLGVGVSWRVLHSPPQDLSDSGSQPATIQPAAEQDAVADDRPAARSVQPYADKTSATTRERAVPAQTAPPTSVSPAFELEKRQTLPPSPSPSDFRTPAAPMPEKPASASLPVRLRERVEHRHEKRSPASKAMPRTGPGQASPRVSRDAPATQLEVPARTFSDFASGLSDGADEADEADGASAPSAENGGPVGRAVRGDISQEKKEIDDCRGLPAAASAERWRVAMESARAQGDQVRLQCLERHYHERFEQPPRNPVSTPTPDS